MPNDSSLNPEEQKFEMLIDGLLTQQYGFCDDFIDPETIAGLRQNLLQLHASGQMHPAGVGRNFDYQRNTEVRGDVIKWIEPDSTDPHERRFQDQVADFVRYLNQSCYTGINAWEFHYAFYEQGSFYKRHLDQFKSNKGRKFSLVTYLNDNWQESDGGKLALFLDATKQDDLYPIGGRAVFFKSDEIEHEVHASHTRYRISIAGWLKRI